MAVARAQGQGGLTAIHVWLIVFVALWLTSTVLLVILYLDQEKNLTAAEEVRADIAKVISTDGKKLPQWPEAKPNPGATMVDLIEAARAETATLVSGNPADQAAALRQGFDERVNQLRANPFVAASGVPFAANTYADALDDVTRRFLAAAEARAEAEKGLGELTRELETLRGTQTGQKDEFVAGAEQLRADIAKLRADYEESRQAHVQQITEFEQQIEAIQAQCTEDIQAQRTLTADCVRDYDDLFDRFEQLKAKLGQSQVSPIPLATVRGADGKVLKATPGDNVVYIDLGKRDHLTPGLEFAVYDALEGVPEDGRAKARIEVTTIYDETALCTVVAMLSNDLIRSDDLIANPVYDRIRTLKFFVLGDFDLDGDQKSDPDGADRIAAIIERWGGIVEPRLNAQVDFVVLGGPPPTPRRSPEYDEVDDVRYQAEKQVYDRYEAQINSVRALAVPSLTQSVFLNFLGQTRDPVAASNLGTAP